MSATPVTPKYWAVVELTPAPSTDVAGATLQRVIIVRDTLDAAERVLEVLNATSLGDEVFAIQSRWS